MTTKSKPDYFSRRLRELREAAGLSVYALAKRSGVASQQLYRIEAGVRTCTWETVVKLADALAARTDDFR